MNRKRMLIAAVAVVAAAAIAVTVWLVLSRDPRAGVHEKASGPVVTSTVGPNASMPAMKAGSEGCAAMDGVLSHLLASTPEGRAFTEKASTRLAATGGSVDDDSSATQWIAFLRVLAAHRAELADAAGHEETARGVLGDLDTVVDVQPKLLDGTIAEFDDPEEAMRRIQAGEDVEERQEYRDASKRVSDALDRLSWCMPTWPVVF
ncbi:hypothetical protein H8R18_01640 [Nanchangia anserum]|uniref:Uncharacterized protein n=1 Tax=Nanchangia anserum TaxID=2692125 RepID=A0A8I0GC93_9ACTO|nr:hypothetical protein [Nanchangia anserum]MBD3690118.1 hypothetical protein [Nanchangia anserum]QOX82097.1 hypothetical protein H8R18_01640 [Nanchangia anserum]